MREHYATKLKRRIKELEIQNNKYYDAIYRAKEKVGIRQGVHGGSELAGNEENLLSPGSLTTEYLIGIISELP